MVKDVVPVSTQRSPPFLIIHELLTELCHMEDLRLIIHDLDPVHQYVGILWVPAKREDPEGFDCTSLLLVAAPFDICSQFDE